MNSISSLRTIQFQWLSVRVTDGTTTPSRVNTENLEQLVMFPVSDWPVKVFYEFWKYFKRIQKNPEEHLNNGQFYYLN